MNRKDRIDKTSLVSLGLGSPQRTSEQRDTSKPASLASLLNPKFAKVPAEQPARTVDMRVAQAGSPLAADDQSFNATKPLRLA
jgi:hypothetical protein